MYEKLKKTYAKGGSVSKGRALRWKAKQLHVADERELRQGEETEG